MSGAEAPPRRALDVRTRNLGGELFVARGTDAFQLSGVAGTAWRLMDGRRTLPEIAEEIATATGAGADVVLADLEALVEDLRRRGIVAGA